MKAKISLFLILLLACIFVLILEVMGLVCPVSLWANSVGTPRITTRRNDFLCTGISQIVSDDNSIYVLFGAYNVVQVYSKDGVYQYTISIYNHMNGKTRIKAKNNCLYIRDKIGNIYTFESKEQNGFLPRKSKENQDESSGFNKTDPNYIVKNGSIFRVENGAEGECVIARPAWLSVYQNNVLILILFALVILAGWILLFPKI